MNDHEEYDREYPTRAEEKTAEIALDVADEERYAAEAARAPETGGDCEAEFIDGSWAYCGCDGCDAEEADHAAEWRPGECDHCYGETVSGPLGDIHCACAIGQGASPEDCRCGPEDEAVAAS